MKYLTVLLLGLLLLAGCVESKNDKTSQNTATGGDTKKASIEENYNTNIKPIIANTCKQCHGKFPQFEVFSAKSALITKMLESGKMPPKSVTDFSEADRTKILTWIKTNL